MCVPSLPTRPGSFASASSDRVAARALVDLDDRVALPALDGDGNDLLGQAALVGGGQRALVGAQRPAVDVGAGQLELVADLGGLVEHLLAGERVGQAVVDHRVDRLGVAHAEAEARARAAGRGRLDIDSMPPPTPTSTSPARIALSSSAGGADARGADLVDRLGGDLLRDAALDLRLARGDLALAGLQHLAHDDVLDLLGLDARRARARPRSRCRRARWRRGGQAAAELADRGAGGAEDHGLGHRVGLSGGRCESAEATLRSRLRRRWTSRATTDAAGRTGADTIAVGALRGRGIAHDVAGGALPALLDSGEARPEPRARRRRRTPTASAGSSSGLGKRDELRRRARAGRRRGRRGRARASSGRASLCWGLPAPRRRRGRRRRSSRARCSPPTASTATRARRRGRRRPARAARRRAPTTTCREPVGRAAVIVAEAQQRARATCRTRPPTT